MTVVHFSGLNFGRTYQSTLVAVTQGEYEKGFKTIGTFNTVEQFWTCYSHITRAEALPNLDLHMFKDGIKPMWEDAANKIGGKAMVRVHKTLAARCWEAVVRFVVVVVVVLLFVV